MQITEEVDALRTIGIPPMDLLVLPKLLALTIALPLLTVFADALSVFGGMVMARALLEVSFSDFIDRFPMLVTPTSCLPVSYTQLDVYKRQARRGVWARSGSQQDPAAWRRLNPR